MSAPQNQTSDTPTPAPAPAPRRSRTGRRIAGVLLGAILLLATLLIWMVQFESGTRLLWNTSVWALQGRLSGNFGGGTLASGIRVQQLSYRDATTIASVDSIDGSWHLGLAARCLTINYLRVGNVDLQLQPTPSEPTTMPASLRLPLALTLNDIALKQLRLQQGTTVTELSDLLLHGDSDGTQHTLVLDRLTTPYGKASAMLHLNGQQPFVISGGAELAGAWQQEKFQLAATLSGSLQQLGIQLNASGDKLNGNANIVATPFDTVPLQRADIDLQHVNPQTFSASAPQADLRVTAKLAPLPGQTSALPVAGTLNIENALPGRIDQQRLPLMSARAEVHLDSSVQTLRNLRIRLLQNASIDGSGEYRTGTDGKAAGGDFALQIAGLDLHALHQQLQATTLRGPLTLKLTPGTQTVALALSDPRFRVQLDASLEGDKLTLQQAQLNAGKSRLQLDGSLITSGDMRYAAKGRLSNFNPADWIHAAPAKGKAAAKQPASANINMDFNADGVLAPELQAQLAFRIHDSSYAQLPMSGSGKLKLAGQRLLPSTANLEVAGNRLQLDGSFGAPSDRLNLHVDAPQLARLGYGISGLLQLDGNITGSLQRPSLKATYRAEQLAFGAHRLAKLSGQADIQTDLAAALDSAKNKLMLSVAAQGYEGPDARLKQLDLNLSGTYGQHALTLHADGNVHARPLQLELAAHGKLSQNKGVYAWNGSLDKLVNGGFPRTTLAAPVTLTLGADDISAGAAQLSIEQTAVALQHFSLRQGRIASAGSIKALDVARLLQLAQEFGMEELPFKTDLILDSNWDFALGESASGFFQLARKSGDIRINVSNTEVALGVSDIRLRADLQGNQLKLDAHAAAARIGTFDAKGQAALQRQGKLLTLTPDAALQAQAELNVPQLKSIATLLGPQIALNGAVAMQLKAGGTLNKPALSGTINGDAMAVTLFDQGIQLKDGIARIVMDNNVIDLRQLVFHGGDGTLSATGKVQLGASNPDLNATIVADRLQLFASPDRQLMLSGQAKLANVNEQLRIDGKFVVDKALFDLPKTSAPKLGDDVVVVRNNGKAKTGAAASSKDKLAAATEKPAGRFAPFMTIDVDLGNDFRFRGTGADLLLRGGMTVRSEPYAPLRASGSIYVANGTYEAFGTKLNIERGIINFQGPISNPNLNILAMRRNQDVEAGVEVTGNASQPRIRLVSEPSVSDEEKLSWIMFGHGSDSSGLGQRNATGQALAFIGNLGGKKIAKDLGLDQFSIGASESGLDDEQVVNIGKAISEKLSVGYEQSLTGAASIAKATWQLSRRWSVVARAGAINGLNILFNRRFD